jgi:hypothetical protein
VNKKVKREIHFKPVKTNIKIKGVSRRSGVGDEDTLLIIFNTNFFWNASLFFLLVIKKKSHNLK